MINSKKLKRLVKEAEQDLELCKEASTLQKQVKDLKERLLELLEELNFRYIKRPIYRIKKIVRWLPIIWKDEDWDYYYLLRMLEVKLQDMKECMLDENIVAEEDLKLIADSIDETCKHMNNYVNDYEVYDELHPLPFEIEYKHEPTGDGKGYYVVEWNADKSRPLNKTEQAQYKRYLRGLWKFENQEWNAIWDTIKENGRHWWD